MLKISKTFIVFSIFALLFLALAASAQAQPQPPVTVPVQVPFYGSDGIVTYGIMEMYVYPAAQTPVPDPNGFMVYGVSWALVGSALVGLLLYFGVINDNTAILITAGWTTAGYILVQNLQDLERALPWLPTYLPQLLMAILVFAAQMGVITLARAGKRAYAARK